MEIDPGQQDVSCKRVLMVAACPFPARRGTPVRVERMAEELAALGHDVQVATYHLGDPVGPTGCKVQRIRNIGVYRDTAPGPSWRKLLLADPLLTAKVWSVARNFRPDVIHAHHFEGVLTALPAARGLGIPLVFDAHVLLEGELQYYKMGLPRPVIRLVSALLDGVLPRACSHVVAISPEIRDRLVDHHRVARAAVTVVPNGVEQNFFTGRRRALGEGGGPRLVFAGNLAAYQGVGYLLEALPHVIRRLSTARLVMVTEDNPDEFLAAAAEAGLADHVEVLAASLAELPDVLASADVLLNPRVECPGVPLKLLNYMASGRPIVTFEGSSRYLEDGKSALIVRNGDVEGFAAAILKAVDDTAWSDGIGSLARDYAQEHLSWKAAGVALGRVYARLPEAKCA